MRYLTCHIRYLIIVYKTPLIRACQRITKPAICTFNQIHPSSIETNAGYLEICYSKTNCNKVRIVISVVQVDLRELSQCSFGYPSKAVVENKLRRKKY